MIAIGRSVLHNIKAGALLEGGSTITQQLAKNLFFNQDKVIQRKVAEIFMAFTLEAQYSKEEILELYVNDIYFGEGYYGIGAARRGYYDKEPVQMDLNECTMLAGVPNAPSSYSPRVNPELARKRQAHKSSW